MHAPLVDGLAGPGAGPVGTVHTPDGFVRSEFRAMGTLVTVVLPARDGATAALVEDLFASWEAALSRFRPDSELSLLNAAAGRPVIVSALLLAVVEEALRAARATDGLFDPSMEPALRAIGYDRTFEEVERDGPAVADAGIGVGGAWRGIQVDHARRAVRLPAGAALDLGGIAKGMAVDASIAELVGRGVTSAVVEAGGDLAVAGLPPGQPAWPVAVEVRRGQRDVAIISGGLATSGIGRRAWMRGGVEQHHLLDPRTGEPARNDLWSVTAAAAWCARAEVAAKVAFVLGRDAGARFLLRIGISGLLVLRDGREVLVGPWGEAPAAGRQPGRPVEATPASRGLA